jgi:uncharacterized Ntn-hydrolase superfamily protein
VKRSTGFWILAFCITAVTAIYQRMSGPTYPMSGSVSLHGVPVDYRLDRSHGGDGDHEVRIRTGSPEITGRLSWKRHKTSDDWVTVPMTFADGALVGSLPHQPPAGKLDYAVELRSGNDVAILPSAGGVVIRFKGDVPLFVLIPHVIAMFLAMLLSARTGLEYFSPEPRFRTLTYWTLGVMGVGGLILGPAVQKYAFDAYWTGWPFGHDLTDNKTIVAFLAWVAAAIALAKARSPRGWVLGAAIVTLVIFLIPHSMFGSELDYEALDQETLESSSGQEPARSEARSTIATFSIAARDAATGELGVAVASRFFAVGSVVPWARADVGAVATQSFANTSFGWRGLDALAKGGTPETVLKELLAADGDRDKRQVGIVSASGAAVTYTGTGCLAWAGGRSGPNYAVQGNILAGERVVAALESTFVHTQGTLAERMYAALVAGDREGGDSRGKQSAALLVVRKGAGYGGYTDRAIDIRVDDHQEPFIELGRLLQLAQVNYAWNEGWTLFMEKQFAKALVAQERAGRLAPANPEVLYDLAVIRLAAGKREGALDALADALRLNPKLKTQARADGDLGGLRALPRFKELTASTP